MAMVYILALTKLDLFNWLYILWVIEDVHTEKGVEGSTKSAKMGNYHKNQITRKSDCQERCSFQSQIITALSIWILVLLRIPV